MNIHHHPDDATLFSYTSGALPAALSVVVACHLQACPVCRQRLQHSLQLAGGLLANQAPAKLNPQQRSTMLDLLEQTPQLCPSNQSRQEVVDNQAIDLRQQLPTALAPWLAGQSYQQLPWRSLAPGLRQIKLDIAEGNLRLLRIAPGTSMPIHSHSGSELTLVLRGSYSDEIGRFQSGDLADLDPQVEHQPIADRDEDCICLIATDAPLKFKGIVPRLLQPFFGL
ncbi:ChrR family anti-sigma-E factor [Balneatrix alpica]|uniref:ChrR family anti-sigma-E factor n=1 Tax=Balneatrix alpica TaxID=75684 RepID=A0ABV5ZBV8_9GAMM|nr:ChrR family anti-sigma-E factor [Balneatrix alpica]